MIKVDSRLKYLFDKESKELVDARPLLTCKNVKNGSHMMRKDVIVYGKNRMKILSEFMDRDWDLIHLDGNYKNCNLNNLELVVFEDEKNINNTNIIRKEIRKELKKELIEKDKLIKDLIAENKIKDTKVINIQKQLLYEQNRVRELNKELKEKECEIRRLFNLLSAKETN